MSEATSDAILAEPAAAGAAGVPPPPRPGYGFWSTAGWGVVAILVPAVVHALAIVAIALWRDGGATSIESLSATLHASDLVLGLMIFTSLPATVLILWLAVRLAHVPVADYLAVKPVGLRVIAVAVGCALAYGAACDLVSYATGHGLTVPWVQELYAAARSSGRLWLVVLSAAVAAPVSEELLFRGFLLRGWVASRLGAAGAVALTSAIWAGMHVQYDAAIIAEIFGLGLLFGYLRLRTGSILPTIVAHGVYGLLGMIQAAVLAG